MDANELLLTEVFPYIQGELFLQHLHPAHYRRRKMFVCKDFRPDHDIPDLTGKVILVTGGVYAYPRCRAILD